MIRQKIRQGARYRAKIALGFLEQFASNELIAGHLLRLKEGAHESQEKCHAKNHNEDGDQATACALPGYVANRRNQGYPL